MKGMRAIAPWTESVKSRNPGGAGKIPVRSAPGAAFIQVSAKRPGSGLGQAEEVRDGGGPLERRT